MAGQIPDSTKQERHERAMAEQRKVAEQISASFVGRTLRVLVERGANATELRNANIRSWEHGVVRQSEVHAPQLHGRYRVARGEADAPDIDGRVYVRGKVPLGEFARVRIVSHTDYDLIAGPA